MGNNESMEKKLKEKQIMVSCGKCRYWNKITKKCKKFGFDCEKDNYCERGRLVNEPKRGNKENGNR